MDGRRFAGLRSRRAALWLAGLLVLAIPLAAAAQRGFFYRSLGIHNADYDGRFAFVRVRYQEYTGWAADYPLMERNLTRMLYDITELRPNVDAADVLDLDDPLLLRYPLLYLSEPGYWLPDYSEVNGLRDYLAKGGFLIVDDFHFANEWAVFEAAMRRVLPAGRIQPLELSHPVFDSFFSIKSLEVPYPGQLGELGLMGEFYGIYEDNDPNKRLMVVINYNIDLGDYVEWSADLNNRYSLVPTNEAYKFLINYVLYGLTR
ncbi:MAG: DUF4159 domain-containing protein [Vicinamibacterales bacterium]